MNAGQLTILLASSDLASAGAFQVIVTNPSPGGGNSQPSIFTVQPAATATLQSLTLNPTTIVGGGSVSGTVSLSAGAPAGGSQVQLSSTSPSAQVPASVTVASGQTSANFTITTTTVTANQNATISATLGSTTKTATLTVTAATSTPTLQNLTLNPTTVVGGGSVSGTVSLSATAPAGGSQVQLSSSSASAQVPTSVTVASGQTSVNFTVATTSVTANQNVTVSAILGATTKTAALAITTAPVSSPGIYVGTDTGIYKSIDGGATWQQSLGWPQASFGFIGAISIDPQNSSKVYASGVSYNTSGASLGQMLYRSADAGQTWATVKLPASTGEQPVLAIDAVSTNVLYCGSTAGGLYRSTDSGSTWSPTPLAQVYGVTADPTVSGVAYASTLGADSFPLYKSTDFGVTWAVLATNLNLPVNNPGLTSSVTVDPHNSSTLYAYGTGLCVPGSTASLCGLFKSTDGGINWANLGVQGTYSNVSINNTTGVLYAGGMLSPYFGYVVSSSNGGQTWAPINSGLTTTSAVVFPDPQSSNLFVLGQTAAAIYQGGVFRSTNGGGNWTFTQIGPTGGQVLSLGVPAK